MVEPTTVNPLCEKTNDPACFAVSTCVSICSSFWVAVSYSSFFPPSRVYVCSMCMLVHLWACVCMCLARGWHPESSLAALYSVHWVGSLPWTQSSPTPWGQPASLFWGSLVFPFLALDYRHATTSVGSYVGSGGRNSHCHGCMAGLYSPSRSPSSVACLWDYNLDHSSRVAMLWIRIP